MNDNFLYLVRWALFCTFGTVLSIATGQLYGGWNGVAFFSAIGLVGVTVWGFLCAMDRDDG